MLRRSVFSLVATPPLEAPLSHSFRKEENHVNPTFDTIQPHGQESPRHGGYHHALLSAPRVTLAVEYRSWLEVGNDKNHESPGF
jgi:hypothetical protein